MSENNMQAIWDAIAAPLDPSQIKSKPSFYTDKATGKKVEGKSISYIDKTTVEERLNSVVPGDWHFQVTPIVVPTNGSDGQWVVKGSLTICGVTREDFGVNEQEDRFDPPKAAVSDALKRCAALFGLGRELVPGHGSTPAGRSTNVKPSKPIQKPAVAAQDATRAFPVREGISTDETFPFQPSKPFTEFQSGDWTAFWPFVARYTGKKPSEAHALVHTLTGVESMKECPWTFGDFMQVLDEHLSAPAA